MGYKNRAYVIDNNLILSKNQVLPSSATNVDSTNVVKYGGNSLGYAKIVVKAHDTITIASGKALTIVASYGSTTSPSDTLNKVLYTATAPTDGISFAAGDTICEEIIPDSLPDNYKYVKLNYAVTADQSAGHIDAYVVMT